MSIVYLNDDSFEQDVLQNDLPVLVTTGQSGVDLVSLLRLF